MMKLSPRRAEVLSLAALVLQVLFFLLMLLVSAQAKSVAVGIEAWHFLGGVGIWLVLLLQFRQQRLAYEEKLEAEQYQRLRREGKDTSVFESTAIEESLRLAQRRLEWLEKYLLRIFALFISGYMLAMGFWLFRRVSNLEEVVLAVPETIFKSAAFLAGIALLSFLFSRYAVGMSRESEWRPLRAGGSYLFSNALASFALAIVLLVSNAGYPRVERITAYVLIIIMPLIGVEIIWNLILDAFSPRIRGRYRRAAYESRLLGLFSEPGGILHTAAQAIDYQFGFKVSETWFFQLLSRTFVWLLLAMAATLYISTSLVIVPTGCLGVLERFGEPVNLKQPYQAGLHFTWPRPIDVVRIFPVEQLQNIEVGFIRKDPIIDEKTGREIPDLTPILWTKEHWKEEFPFMVALNSPAHLVDKTAQSAQAGKEGSDGSNDFDMLVLAFEIHFHIKNIEHYGYNYTNPRELLESICNQEAVHFCAQSDIESLLGPGRHKTSATLQKLIQQKADKLGVEVTFVGLESVHPPIKVSEAFEKVIGALQEKQAKILIAHGESNRIIDESRGESAVIKYDAQAYAQERSEVARATSERFLRQNEAYQKGNNVYLWREYLSVLEEKIVPLRKYVILSDKLDRMVHEIDLKEKLQPDIFEGLQMEQEQETGK